MWEKLPSTYQLVVWDFWTINRIIGEVNDAAVFQKKHLKVRETPFSYQEYDNSSDEMTHTFRQTSTLPKKSRKVISLFPTNPSNHFPEKTNSTNPGASTPAPLRCIRFIIISFRLKLFSDGTRTLQNQGHQNVPWVHTGVTPGFRQVFFNGLVGFVSFSLL